MDIVGRDAERAFLRERLNTLSDEPRAVVVRGESGVGKSCLVRAFVQEAAGTGAVVISGACLDLDGDWPFQPLKAGVDAWHRWHLPPEDRPRRTDVPDARTVSLMAQVRELLAPTTNLQVALPAVYEALVATAAHRTVVWCLDDLQWVDSATRGLMTAVMAAPPPCSLFIVAAATSADLALADDQAGRTLQRTLIGLEASPRVDALTLEPLSRQDSILLAEGLGWTGDPARTEDLFIRSQGNPFHLTELVRHGSAAAETGTQVEDPTAMPQMLRQRLVARWSTQPPLCVEAVAAVAVSPAPVPHEALLGALDEPEREVTAALRHAVAGGLLRSDDDGYVMAHRLLGEAVASDLLPGQRRSLHRRLAQQYTTLSASGTLPGDHRATRAYHWSRAGQPERALPDLLAAADEADRSQSAAAAWSLWQAVLQTAGTVSPDQIPARLLWAAAAAAHRAGDAVAAVQLTDGLVDPETDGNHAVVRAHYLAAAGRLVSALETLEAVQRTESQAGVRESAVALSAELSVRTGSFRVARDQAAALVRDAQHQVTTTATTDGNILRAGVALGFSEAYLGNTAAGRHWLELSLRRAEASGDVDVAALAYRHLSELLAGPQNDLEEGVRIAQVGAARVTELGGKAAEVAALVATGASGLFRLGRLQEAAEWVTGELGHRHVGHALAELLSARARIVMALGQLDQADRDIDCAAILLADDLSEQQQLPLDTLRAGSALWRGQVDEARQAVRAGLAKVRAGYEDQWRLAPLIWHGLRAEGDAASRNLPVDLPWAQELMKQLEHAEKISAGNVQDTVKGYRLLCAAETGRAQGVSDPDAWARAAEHWQTRTHPYPATYARLHQAHALFAQRSRHHEAATVLRLAHDQAVRMGAGPLAEEMESLARLARVRLSAPAEPEVPSTPDEPGRTSPIEAAGLSRRETEVLALVAQGRTNREIGEALFISERTVGVHVSKVLSKLQVRSRVQASSWYVRVAAATPSPPVASSSLRQ